MPTPVPTDWPSAAPTAAPSERPTTTTPTTTTPTGVLVASTGPSTGPTSPPTSSERQGHGWMRLDGLVYTLAAGDAEVCLTVITSIEIVAAGSDLASDPDPPSFALRVQFRSGERGDDSTIYGSVTTSVAVGTVVTRLRIPYVSARLGIGRIAAFVAPSDQVNWAARIMADNVQGLINITELAATDGCDEADATATSGRPTSTGDVDTPATATAAPLPPSTAARTGTASGTSTAAVATSPARTSGTVGITTAAPFRTTPTSGGDGANVVPGGAGDPNPAGEGSDANAAAPAGTIAAIVVIAVAVLVLAAAFVVQRVRRQSEKMDMVSALEGFDGTAAAPAGRPAVTNPTLHSWLDATTSSGTRHTSPEAVYDTQHPRPMYAEIADVPSAAAPTAKHTYEYQLASGAEVMEVSPEMGIDADSMIRPVNPRKSHDVRRSLRGTLDAVTRPSDTADEAPPTPPRMSLSRGKAHRGHDGGAAEMPDVAYEPVVRDVAYEPVDRSRPRTGRRVTKRQQASAGLDPDYDVGGARSVSYDVASPTPVYETPSPIQSPAPVYETPSPIRSPTAQTPMLLVNPTTDPVVPRARTGTRKEGNRIIEYVSPTVVTTSNRPNRRHRPAPPPHALSHPPGARVSHTTVIPFDRSSRVM